MSTTVIMRADLVHVSNVKWRHAVIKVGTECKSLLPCSFPLPLDVCFDPPVVISSRLMITKVLMLDAFQVPFPAPFERCRMPFLCRPRHGSCLNQKVLKFVPVLSANFHLLYSIG